MTKRCFFAYLLCKGTKSKLKNLNFSVKNKLCTNEKKQFFRKFILFN
jgi:hypothetical protein